MYTEQKQDFDHEYFIQMSSWDFDQSPNGWRKLADQDRDFEAALLIKEYIDRNKEKLVGVKDGKDSVSVEFMKFHIGQLLAFSGPEHYTEAIQYFKESYYKEGNRLFNAYIIATIGFLEGDIDKVNMAINFVDKSDEVNKASGNIGIIRNFREALENGDTDYKTVYMRPRN